MSGTKLPGFVCVGAAKCGTTSLYHYLKGHPDIFLTEQKELHFFSSEDLLERPNGPGMRYVLEDIIRSEEEYRALFSAVPDNAISGDISPSYLNSPSAPSRIKDLLGDVRIIIMLRDPVDRMYSQYMHLRRAAREDLDFEAALAAEDSRFAQGWGDMWLYRRSAMSADSVERYFDTFGRDNVKVILASEMREDTLGTVMSIQKFIGVAPRSDLDLEGEFNRSGLPKSRLVARALDASPLATFAKKVVPRGIGAAVKRKLQEMNTGERMVLSAEDRAKYASIFSEDTRRLEALLGRELPWGKPS
ncbi:sulfotransferase [Qipengyuania xiapuensis]|uniref:Sulfotransferase n=1 Tax=Qipengyuania xiapuensis TaxID=2867236 RepID=A0ABX8ZV13_9SPHN|nr:sulfotransferase [Qipengyuania xiapuensis]QZD92871.1 sulfotransferase [Qipengyuania xiapuensis]